MMTFDRIGVRQEKAKMCGGEGRFGVLSKKIITQYFFYQFSQNKSVLGCRFATVALGAAYKEPQSESDDADFF